MKWEDWWHTAAVAEDHGRCLPLFLTSKLHHPVNLSFFQHPVFRLVAEVVWLRRTKASHHIAASMGLNMPFSMQVQELQLQGNNLSQPALFESMIFRFSQGRDMDLFPGGYI